MSLRDDPDPLIRQLAEDEGEKRSAYQDSEGWWTIGCGRLIDARKGGGLSGPEIKMLLQNDIAEKEAQLDREIPWWRGQYPVRQRVMVMLCFNMGIGNLLGFPNMLKAWHDGVYWDAANHLRTSLWAKQVGPKRSERLIRMLENGLD